MKPKRTIFFDAVHIPYFTVRTRVCDARVVTVRTILVRTRDRRSFRAPQTDRIGTSGLSVGRSKIMPATRVSTFLGHRPSRRELIIFRQKCGPVGGESFTAPDRPLRIFRDVQNARRIAPPVDDAVSGTQNNKCKKNTVHRPGCKSFVRRIDPRRAIRRSGRTRRGPRRSRARETR